MEIEIAKSAGFCFGVQRAMDTVLDAAKASKNKLYTYGDLIHNKEAIRLLEEKGVSVCYDLKDVKNTDSTVFIRAHGVPPNIFDEINEKGFDCVDLTCPYVKKIHKIVDKAKKDSIIIIIGDRMHPEVVGINGWAGGNAVIINTTEEATALNPNDFDKKVTLVVQTTFNHLVFESIKTILLEKFNDINIFNTTCTATAIRQKEAINLSKNCDIMLVVGDKKSANSKKLYDLCVQNGKKTFFLETFYDLELKNFKKDVKIGITAGASTMRKTLKEVAQFMSEFEKNVDNEQFEDSMSFAEMLEGSLVTLHNGDIVKGSVISISSTQEVSVNLNFKSDGIIERGEYSSDPSVVPSQELKPGDEIEVFVMKVNDGDGNVLLSKKRLESQKNMEFVEKAFENNEVIEVKVVEIVKAGLIGLYKGVRIFVPYSQVSNRYVEDINVYKGTTLNIKILELDKTKRRIVGGRKELARAEEEARRAEVFAKLENGQKVSGTVSRIVDFGAFVDLGGVDGLIHISEMSWGSIRNPKEVLKEGQTVTVVVLDVNREKGKIALSLKDVSEDPWKNIEERYQKGQIVTGKVARIAPFGAFVELEEGVDGLVHISQISAKRIEHCEDELTPGEEIKVMIMELDPAKRKISLSKKEVDTPTPVAEEALAQE